MHHPFIQKKFSHPIRTVLALLLSALTVFCAIPKWSLVIPVSAATVAEDKQKVKMMEDELSVLKTNSHAADTAYKEALDAYKETVLDLELAEKAKAALDSDIRSLQAEIDKTNELFLLYNDQLSVYEKAVAEKQAEIEERYQTFLERIRINYEDSFTSYLEIVLKSDSFSDLLYHLDVVASLLDYDNRVLKSLDRSKQDLSALVQDYQALQFKTGQTLDELNNVKMPELERKVAENENLVNQMNALVMEAREKKDMTEAEKAKFDAQVAKKEQDLLDAEAELAEKIRLAQEEQRRKEEEQRRKEEEERRKQEEAAGVKPKPQPKPKPKPQPKPNDYVGGELAWPLDLQYNRISSYFVWRINPIYGYKEHHNGIDIPAPYGTNVYAANDGTVIISGTHDSYGEYIVIDHGGGLSTLYAHNSKRLVEVGDVVKKGDVISKVGATGDVTGNHLHFTVRENGTPVDPLGYVNQP